MKSELLKLIREILDTQPDGFVDEIAAAVVRRTPAAKLPEFYEEALRPVVVAEHRLRRNAAMNKLDGALAAQEAARAEEDVTEDAARDAEWDAELAAAQPTLKPKRDPHKTSSRVAAIRTWWQQVLDSHIWVKGVEMRLGDCTVADFDYIIEDYDSKAAGFTAKADQLREYRKMVLDHHAATLDDCPSPEAAA